MTNSRVRSDPIESRHLNNPTCDTLGTSTQTTPANLRRLTGRVTLRKPPIQVYPVDFSEDISAGQSTTTHAVDTRQRTLNPQVPGSNPGGRTLSQLNAHFGPLSATSVAE